jgi:hypothetical protein
MNNLSLLIGSCDDYSFLWKNFTKQCDKFFQVNCEKIFVSETKKEEFKNYKFHAFGFDIWSNRIIKSLNLIESEFIFFVLDDYFFREEISENFIKEKISFMNERNANKYIITTIHDAYKVTFLGQDLYKQNDNSDYLTSLQPAIWRKSFLQNCLKENWNPWEFEIIGTEYIKYNDNKIYMQKVEETIYFNAVRKGKIMSEGWEEFYKIHNLHNESY